MPLALFPVRFGHPCADNTSHTSSTGMAHRAAKQQEGYYYLFYTYLIGLFAATMKMQFPRLSALLQLWHSAMDDDIDVTQQ